MGKFDDMFELTNRRRLAYNENGDKKCYFCYICVNDYAKFQCSSCLASHDKISVKNHLKKQCGEFWEERYKKPIKLQKKVRSGKIKEWPTEYSQINYRGDLIARKFYE